MTTATQVRDKVLSIARSQLGTSERSDGTSKYGSWYERVKPAPGFASGAWCQMFMSWIANEAGLPEAAFPRLAYTPYAVQWFKDRGRWGSQPKVGALVYYNFPGGDFVDHVEMVEAVRSDGSIVTIGGNVSNAVRRLVRRYSIAGYGYPDYGVEPAQDKPKPTPNPTEVMVKKLPTLREGDTGWDVKTLHYLLLARDYGGLDGLDDTTFTPAHTAGVKGLQKAAGITVDGIVGAEETWPVLLRVA